MLRCSVFTIHTPKGENWQRPTTRSSPHQTGPPFQMGRVEAHLPEPLDLLACFGVVPIDSILLPVGHVNLLHAAKHQLMGGKRKDNWFETPMKSRGAICHGTGPRHSAADSAQSEPTSTTHPPTRVQKRARRSEGKSQAIRGKEILVDLLHMNKEWLRSPLSWVQKERGMAGIKKRGISPSRG